MKNKSLKLGLVLSSIINLSSCTNVDKVRLFKSSQDDFSSYVELNDRELVEKQAQNEDIVVFAYLEGCSACKTLKEHIYDYVKETKAIIYAIENYYYNMIEVSENFPLLNGFPTILFYREGKLINQNSGTPSTYQKFKKLMNDNTYLTNINVVNDFKLVEGSNFEGKYKYYHIDYASTDLLDELISSKTCKVLFSWDKCNDCKSLIKEYMFLDKVLKMPTDYYIYKVNYFRDKKNEDISIWTNFAQKYGFDTFKGGRIPTYVKYVDGVKSDMVVYLNEGDIYEEDGYFLYKEAFFDEVNNLRCKSKDELREEAKKIELIKFDEFLGIKK